MRGSATLPGSTPTLSGLVAILFSSASTFRAICVFPCSADQSLSIGDIYGLAARAGPNNHLSSPSLALIKFLFRVIESLHIPFSYFKIIIISDFSSFTLDFK